MVKVLFLDFNASPILIGSGIGGVGGGLALGLATKRLEYGFLGGVVSTVVGGATGYLVGGMRVWDYSGRGHHGEYINMELVEWNPWESYVKLRCPYRGKESKKNAGIMVPHSRDFELQRFSVGLRFRHYQPIGSPERGYHHFWLRKARRGFWIGTWALGVGTWNDLRLTVTDEKGEVYTTPSHIYADLLRKINEKVGDWHELWATFTQEKGYITVDGEMISWDWPKRITLVYTDSPIILCWDRAHGEFDFDWIVLEVE